MIRFQCEHCGARLQVAPARAGKEGVCPKCRQKLTIPPPPEPELRLVEEGVPASTRVPSKLLEQVAVRPPPPPTDREERIRRDAYRRVGALRRDTGRAHTGVRRLPWLLDVLLYPASISGLITLGALFVYSLWTYFLLRSGLFVDRTYMPGGALGLYLGWYLAECVYDSARGGTRAPEIIDAGGGLDDLLSRVAYLLAVYAVFALPPVLYRLFTGRADVIFWALMGSAVFLLPMGLLAMVIHDSASALNPLFLLGAIISVCRPYVGLLLTIGGVAGLFRCGNILLRAEGLSWATLALVDIVAGSYAAFLLAHALGRFYWRYRDRLDWGL